MNNAFRLICFYGFTLVLGICLSSLMRPILGELAASSREMLNTSLSSGEFDVEYFLGAMDDPRLTALRKTWEWSHVFYIMFSLILGALLVPKVLHPEKVVNVATAISAGILTSKIISGFPFLDWSEVFFWGAVGLICFYSIFWLRSRQNGCL